MVNNGWFSWWTMVGYWFRFILVNHARLHHDSDVGPQQELWSRWCNDEPLDQEVTMNSSLMVGWWLFGIIIWRELFHGHGSTSKYIRIWHPKILITTWIVLENHDGENHGCAPNHNTQAPAISGGAARITTSQYIFWHVCDDGVPGCTDTTIWCILSSIVRLSRVNQPNPGLIDVRISGKLFGTKTAQESPIGTSLPGPCLS